MSAPALKPQSTAPQGPIVKKLARGEMLFSEGENSRAMYLVKSGMIRIFKKKGDAAIEIDTIRAGQILGELAFLDGNPRSAGGEALTDCELLEISGPTFQSTLGSMPDWLKILLKTVVGRLRSAGTRIRQLETVSSQFEYNDKTGKRESSYVFIPTHELLKTCSGILLAARRGETGSEGGVMLKGAAIHRYATQIMQIPTSKVTSILDALSASGVTKILGDGEEILLTQPEFLEKFIHYVNEENLLEPAKRHDVSPRGFVLMTCIAKHLKSYPEDSEGMSEVNIAQIRKSETETLGRDAFRLDELSELIKLGYCTNINLTSASVATTKLKAKAFMMSYRYQKVLIEIHTINEQKRKGGG